MQQTKTQTKEIHMRKTALFCCLLAFILPLGHKTFAQDAAQTQNAAKPPEPPVHYYHLEFVVQELSPEGKPVNSRAYSTTVATHEMSVIRANSRVPFPTGTFSDAAGNTQYQIQNVGVEIDVRNAHEVGRLLTLNLIADISSLGGSASVSANVRQPIMRQNKWESWVLIPIDKATVVFKSDDLDSKGSMQMVVTATLLQ
jgi:hypothetical protein